MKRKYILPLIILAALAAFLFFGVRTRSMPAEIKLSQTNEDAVVYGADGWGESYSVNDYGMLYARDNVIRYYDLGAEESYALCDKANCLHLNEKCTAWYRDWTAVHGIAYYQDGICLFKRNDDKNTYELIRMDVTGKNQKVIARLDIGDWKSGSWYLSSLGDIYYSAGRAVVGADYTWIEGEGDSSQTQNCIQYLLIDMVDGAVSEVNEKTTDSTVYELQGISEDALFFKKTVSEIEQLSEKEFEEAYASGMFRGEIHTEDSMERYLEYQGKWYPAHSDQKDEYIKYNIKDSSETLLEETPLTMTFDEEGYLVETLSKYIVLGSYEQSYLVSEPDWDHESGEYFLWDLAKNEKTPLFNIEHGGTLAWETGSLALGIYDESKILYCEYIDETTANILEHDLKTGDSRELFEDVRNISFRIINVTEEFFIGKIYTDTGYGVYKIRREDYFAGNLDKVVKLRV
ncbi:hypothetical protein MCG98_18270 [Ruminococcus sp. OA3]|uniref:hypothetical protein n=1 Tax=Ruminococcus sp. OA3 TaxID=2914164 RepID=UPI001F0523F1|nr:hypothetical protein [Ruminococcus sp. OA3]MCH1984502.1 hypothetical protein [Ruminococcus sp. OA3]